MYQLGDHKEAKLATTTHELNQNWARRFDEG
jgi:hypothetical protein